MRIDVSKKIKQWKFWLVLGAFVYPLYKVLNSVIQGSIPFWYDPARDLLLAADNLDKLTLIGQPSGIPGLFYAPYWIWLLSLGSAISKDPRFVDIFVLVLPYFTIMPFILYKLVKSKIFSIWGALAFWLLFTLNLAPYVSHIWNPHLAPLMALILVYLLIQTRTSDKNKKSKLMFLAAGFVGGLVVSFHISFGLGLLVGSGLFLLGQIGYEIARKRAKRIVKTLLHSGINLGAFSLGVLASHAPFFAFELRHNFQQLRTVLEVLSKDGAYVGVTGLSKQEITTNFFKSLGEGLAIPEQLFQYAPYFFFAAIAYMLYLAYTKRLKLSIKDTRYLALLILFIIAILTVYLTSKNPVWDYHFVGIEVIFLLLIAFLASKVRTFQYITILWTIFILASSIYGTVKGSDIDPLSVPNYSTKEHIVDIIISDASSNEYTVFIFSPFIYTYDYSYIFQAKGNNDVPFDPGLIEMVGEVVYIIVPEYSDTNEDQQGFIQYRTPNYSYITEESWNIPDGTRIIKRVKKTE